MQQQGQYNGEKKGIVPEEHLDIALKSILLHYPDGLKQTTIDWDMLRDTYTILVNQAESIAEALNYISDTRRKLDFDVLTPEEQNLMDAIEKYVRTNPKYNEYSAVNMETLKRRYMIEFVEDSYNQKVELKKEELNRLLVGKEGKEKEKLSNLNQAILDQYRFKLIYQAVNRDKAEVAELNM